ncbi:immunity 17 family protein [Soonwooa sp.]|uniref:immunity 17 family protein n=1 Tax=Soonwooa sp. TaxID=1938592 RepID=UPI00260F1E2F|nr:immunity 17 family protein [Soonwooa sp.]
MDEDKIKSWMHSNPGAFGKILSVSLLAVGVFLVLGAIKNWDWLYAPDRSYQSNWSAGQISRYLGRATARIIGAAVGLLIVIPVGAIMFYASFIKSQ